MGSTADQIFLEQTLPLEAMPAPAAAAPTPAPVVATGPSPETLAKLQELVDQLRQESARLVPPSLAAPLLEL